MPSFVITSGSRGFSDLTGKTPVDWEAIDDCDDGGIQIGTAKYPVFGGSYSAWFETNCIISFGDDASYPTYWYTPGDYPFALRMVFLGMDDRSSCGDWDGAYDPTDWPSYIWNEGSVWAINYQAHHYYNYDYGVDVPDVKFEVRLYPNGSIEITFSELYNKGLFGWNTEDDVGNYLYEDEIVLGVTYVFEPTGDTWTIHYNSHVEIVADEYLVPQVSISALCDYLEQGAMVMPQVQVEGTCSMVYHYSGVMKNLVGNFVPGRAVAFSMADHSKQDEHITTWEDGTFTLSTSVFSYFVMLPDEPSLKGKIVVPKV